jgi:hypothetical protein
MNKNSIIMISTLYIFLSVSLCFSEPFASKLAPLEGITKDNPDYFVVQILNASKVPEMGEVSVPPYPGAKLLMARDASPIEVNGNTYTCLRYIKILTIDSSDDVEAFYKSKLNGYKFKSEYGGVIRVFWKSEKDLSPLDVAEMCTTPNISISDTAGMFDALMPGVKTAIEITYQ